MLRKIALEELALDEPLGRTLYGEDGVLLLRKGRRLQAAQVDALRKQTNGAVFVYDEGDEGAASQPSREATGQPASAGSSPHCIPFQPQAAARIERLVETTSEMVSQLAELLLDEELTDVTPFQRASDNLLREIQGDPDQTLHEVLVSQDDRQLAQRCTQLSVLSMSLALELKLDEVKVRQVGTAALLHDTPLFGLDEAQRVPSPQMTAASRNLFRNHPLLADRLLEPVRGVDLNVRAVVRQAHEQLDGSGFPIRLTSGRIHNLARLVNIADAYLTLLDPGLGREGIIPADAMAYLVHHTCEGRFDPAAMKALLQTLSLYPIGSLVALSDGSQARVLRARRDHPQQPVVIRLDASQTIIDLADASLTIREPLNDSAHPRRRLPSHQIGEVMWGLHVA